MEETVAIEEALPQEDGIEHLGEPKRIPKIKGASVTQLPEDLYIPPEALEVFLETFEGPLDLLLYLIKKKNLDILDIPISEITYQYMEYIEIMRNLKLELAADYLVMAALLAEIKSRMLLPRQETEDEEEDPRAQLIRRLQEYEQFKQAAVQLNEMPKLGESIFLAQVQPPKFEKVNAPPDIKLSQLVQAFLEVLKRSDLIATHHVKQEVLSVREKMVTILDLVNEKSTVSFQQCFNLQEGRLGVVVSFIAILTLLKEGLIDIVQTELFGPIYLKAIENE